jgi:hypothetical protein
MSQGFPEHSDALDLQVIPKEEKVNSCYLPMPVVEEPQRKHLQAQSLSLCLSSPCTCVPCIAWTATALPSSTTALVVSKLL